MANRTTTRTEDITTRLTSCRCGCKGQDPWHKASYKRVVRNRCHVSEDRTTAAGHLYRILVRGQVQLPGKGLVSVYFEQRFSADLNRWMPGLWWSEDSR